VGHGDRQFHLVGHDWRGSLSWIIADRWPERIASLTMLSRPHPASFAGAMKTDPEQPHRSRSHNELLDPGAGPGLFADNGKWVLRGPELAVQRQVLGFVPEPAQNVGKFPGHLVAAIMLDVLAAS
jgi:pimeloyl-ACP methyl ester carboxylesterase